MSDEKDVTIAWKDVEYISSIMMEALENGCIECKKCGNNIEMDAPKCFCGWKNPI